MRYCALPLFVLLILSSQLLGETTLPVGPNPPALIADYFPDRMHTFVWRNWNLVETDRLAKVLETSAENVRAIASSMGLPAEEAVTEQFKARIYITVIRRNWHLLPYDQLLTLLDWPAERLASTLREDDFLYHKLGQLKPRCEKLVYHQPDETTRAREREIRRLVESEFGSAMKQPAEPRFTFLNEFKNLPAGQPLAIAPQAGLRFIYSYFATYGDPLLNPSLDPYPDGLLNQLAAMGVNGVWLHTVLRDLAPSATFPQFGLNHQRRLETLRNLVNRARRFGIRVYLYMNEPRAMPAEFFKDHPGMAGVREGDYVAMCTSNPAVRAWLSDSLAYVCKNVPDLGGVFTITASENLTSCASHHHSQSCPRCSLRSEAEIIAEVNTTIEQGVHRANPEAKVIAWDWGWSDTNAPDIIAKLPKSIWFMSVSEWSLPIVRGGVASTVGEYSLSAVGPGPRATSHWTLARDAGLKTVAKIAANNTWELSPIPAIPVLDLVAQHAHNLASANIDGLMLSWSLGGYPSINLQVASRLIADAKLSTEVALNDAAVGRYGPVGAPFARKAWTQFSQAFGQYPYNGSVIYNCPVQMGPANPLYHKATGYHSSMVGIPYDSLNTWRGPYRQDLFAQQFEKVADGWAAGLEPLEQAAKQSPPELRPAAEGDLRLARAAWLHFQSVVNQSRFVMLRDELAKPITSKAQRQDDLKQIEHILDSEITLAKQLFDLTRADSRIGFEASNQYYYVPQDLIEKVINCRSIAAHGL